MITTRLFVIEKDIQKMYGGGIGPVTMCLNTFQKDYELTDKSKMLKEVGIATACEANLIYDFKPIQAPMLTTKFNYRTGNEDE